MSGAETVDSSNETRSAPVPPKWSGSALQRVVMGVDRVSFGLIIVTMAAMTIIVTAQVLWRHVLNSSIDSADELSRLLFVWAMFLAIPHGIKYGVHVGIDLMVSFMAPAVKELVFRLMSFAAAVLMAAVTVAAWSAAQGQWEQLMPTLPITAAIFYIAILTCTAHSLLHLVLFAWGGSSIWGGKTL